MHSQDRDRSPQSVQEAVCRARELHGAPDGGLLFGDDVDEGVAGLASDAVPPEKILVHLEVLARLAAARREGPLGTTAIRWLETQNVVASGESESTRSSSREMARRTWHDGRQRRAFVLHTKPSDGTRPDRCVRIYFDWDAERNVIVIGWVGRHP
ncbi:hypothetical protein [Enhygromyxa salina]|uniref:Uncharacterized protein n=1 Tax=Enhygromyxa salina TaxID=215803 RepID=A0A2S9Y607_9BACT|nr:hypothetical protein [Enhygromyxa salina]PRQ00533.1 hypothetical protein ENSA7_60270 [Enhygromyxa salina]